MSSLRLAMKRARSGEERSGTLVRRSLGGVVWYEEPRAIREFAYRTDRPRGTYTDHEEPYAAARE